MIPRVTTEVGCPMPPGDLSGTYLQGISSEEIISTVNARRASMMHATAGFDL